MWRGDGDKLLDVKIGGVAVKEFEYDLAGRTKEITTSAGTTVFTYDHESRAVTMTGPGMAQTNVYNGLDTRVGSTTNSVANTYLRNGAYVTAPVIKDSTATFTPGVSERRGTTTTFSHSGLKNADAQSGVSQAVNATQQYDAFGNLASSTGTWQGQFGYGGGFGYQQDATVLKLLGHRFYDASTGRFLTRDPIKDGRNWYGYSAGDPLAFTDPDGMTAAALLPVAAAAALADGPLPIGDAVGLGILAVAGIMTLVEMARVPPFSGPAGETIVGPNTSRRYGPDGYPETDRDWDTTHNPPDHSHDWGGPGEGGPPTHGDRSKPRPPKPGDPPPPTNHPAEFSNVLRSKGIVFFQKYEAAKL